MIDWRELRLRFQLWLHQCWPFRVIAAIRLVLNAWREPPATREEYEQYHDAKMAAESGIFKRDAANENKRPVPELSAEQIAFHGGITANRAAFSLNVGVARAYLADAECLENSPLTQIDAAINAIAALDPRALVDEGIQRYLRLKYERPLDAPEVAGYHATALRIAKQLLSNTTTLAAIKAAKAGKVTGVSIDDI